MPGPHAGMITLACPLTFSYNHRQKAFSLMAVRHVRKLVSRLSASRDVTELTTAA